MSGYIENQNQDLLAVIGVHSKPKMYCKAKLTGSVMSEYIVHETFFLFQPFGDGSFDEVLTMLSFMFTGHGVFSFTFLLFFCYEG